LLLLLLELLLIIAGNSRIVQIQFTSVVAVLALKGLRKLIGSLLLVKVMLS